MHNKLESATFTWCLNSSGWPTLVTLTHSTEWLVAELPWSGFVSVRAALYSVYITSVARATRPTGWSLNGREEHSVRFACNWSLSCSITTLLVLHYFVNSIGFVLVIYDFTFRKVNSSKITILCATTIAKKRFGSILAQICKLLGWSVSKWRQF